MGNYNAFRLEEPSDAYVEKFVSVVRDSMRGSVHPFSWRIRESLELFIDDNKAYLTHDVIQSFIQRAAQEGRKVECHFRSPVTANEIPFQGEPNTAVKLICLAEISAVGAVCTGECHGVVSVERYCAGLQEEFLKRFLSDQRLRVGGSFYYSLYEQDVKGELLSFADRYQHLYLLHKDKLVAYVGGEELDSYRYRRNIFFVDFVWVDADVDGGIRGEVRSRIDRWLARHSLPWAAAIYINNPRSQRFFARRGFFPRMVRYSQMV